MPADLWANYRLGIIYVDQANAGAQNATGANVKDLLQAARTRFANVVTANPDTDEANRARQYIARIDAALTANPGAR
jgi:hypothetical protein